MEITTTAQEPQTGSTTNHLFRDLLVSLLIYPLALFIPIKIQLTLQSEVMHMYGDIGAELPGLTVSALHFSGALAQYGIILATTVGPLLASIHVALRTDASRQRRFVRAFAAVLIVTTSVLVFALCLPLITT